MQTTFTFIDSKDSKSQAETIIEIIRRSMTHRHKNENLLLPSER